MDINAKGSETLIHNMGHIDTFIEKPIVEYSILLLDTASKLDLDLIFTTLINTTKEFKNIGIEYKFYIILNDIESTRTRS